MSNGIDAETLRKALAGETPPIVLDVRRQTDREVAPAMIPGAVWRDPGEIAGWLPGLQDGPLVVYCVRGGSVSRGVAEGLAGAGRAVRILDGGLAAWVERGFSLAEPGAAEVEEPGIRTSAVEQLRRAGMAEEDIRHSVQVAKKALEIARRCATPLDLDLVGRGALFHDLGKARTHEIEHGRIGAEMGGALGLSPAITAVMEKHIRGGLSPAEAAELGLPVKDYTLHRLEERIIIYADRLVDIISEGVVSLADDREAELRFEEILTTMPRYGKNAATLARYLGYHREIQALMRAASPS